MHTRPSELSVRPSIKTRDGVYSEFYNNSTAPRINTDEVLVEAIRKHYPQLHLTITPSYNCSFLAYAAAGHAQAIPADAADNSESKDLKWRMYMAPARRLGNNPGFLYDATQFGKYIYKWRDNEYILYNVIGSDGPYKNAMSYLLGTPSTNDELMLAACQYMHDVHNSVLVFDGGQWQQSRELWQSVQNSNWDDVILDAGMKKSIIGEVTKFFNSQERYKKLKVPWKRGVIFHGPPGNGKTISIKAMMHSLYDKADPIPTLYVRSLASYGGPEYSVNQIFSRARKTAPCLLVFEDLDSIVTDAVRSYFLNEVDGLQSNDGIMMVGSTNHLERLDPGISKRPSRFDRKYLFPDPNLEERIKYCEYWREKLSDNEDVEFPELLNEAIAKITDGFSFAYIQEAFVAALLAIANKDGDEDVSEEEHRSHNVSESLAATLSVVQTDLDSYVLWREMKKVVKTLRDELGSERDICDGDD